MKSKKRFIAVIGGRSHGKSTIIRALTGVKGKKTPEHVRDLSTNKWMLVISHSPQEEPITPHVLQKEIRRAATSSDSLGIVIALQPTNPTRRISMEDVFKMTEHYGFERYAFVIAKPYNGLHGNDPEAIRIRLESFDVEMPIQPLNARRFAHVNASAIRDIVGLF